MHKFKTIISSLKLNERFIVYFYPEAAQVDAMEETAYLDDICRLCLSNKSRERFRIFSKIEETTKDKFENVTGTDVSKKVDFLCSFF